MDSRFFPLPRPTENGDYLAAWDDHDSTRQLYRHSPRDAEAYDEYAACHGAAKGDQANYQSILPDPTSLHPRDLFNMLKVGQYAVGFENELYTIAKLVTQSSADLLEEWFETDALKGTKVASGIIGTFLGPLAWTAYVLLHHYMGEIDGHSAPGVLPRTLWRGQRLDP